MTYATLWDYSGLFLLVPFAILWIGAIAWAGWVTFRDDR